MKNPRLWQRLSRFAFDADEGSAPYSVKLAAEEGWSPAYTARVIEEYRRFLYLTQVGDGQATPSVAVDWAWHTHLTFTHSYWDKLCGEVLQAALHHEPCIGDEEMPRYADQYRATKALYVEEFGETPPADIWPEGAPASRHGVQNAALASGLLSAGAVSLLMAAFWLGEDRVGMALAGFAVGIPLVALGLLTLPKRFGASRNKVDGGGCGAVSGCGHGGCDGGGGGGD